jgi:prepilin-type N-terminal cleavage/methylation domain-containing protein
MNNYQSFGKFRAETRPLLTRPPARAFTLIELVVVIVIAAVIAAVFVSTRGTPLANRINAAANRIQSDIRYAQSYAVAYQKRSRISFDTGAESYSLYYEQTANNWVLMTEPLAGKNYTVSFTSGDYNGVDIVSTNFDGAGRGLVFNAAGTPYSYNPTGGATAVLAAQGNVTISGGVVITVEPNTGRVVA